MKNGNGRERIYLLLYNYSNYSYIKFVVKFTRIPIIFLCYPKYVTSPVGVPGHPGSTDPVLTLVAFVTAYHQDLLNNFNIILKNYFNKTFIDKKQHILYNMWNSPVVSIDYGNIKHQIGTL